MPTAFQASQESCNLLLIKGISGKRPTNFREEAKNRNVCVFSTLPGGYLPCVESIEDCQLKISTVRREYHHPLGVPLVPMNTPEMSRIIVAIPLCGRIVTMIRVAHQSGWNQTLV